MRQLIERLQNDFPDITFIAGDRLRWSFASCTITYQPSDHQLSSLGLLHELGHAILGHRDYHTDIGLLKHETAAWIEAEKLAKFYGISLNAAHTEDCLDSYRDWLHRRSTCPTCGGHGLQQDPRAYWCPNCHNIWRVSPNRFCRAYRIKAKAGSSL